MKRFTDRLNIPIDYFTEEFPFIIKDTSPLDKLNIGGSNYSEKEVLLILETLWERLDIWYNHEEDIEFNIREWFNECELKKK
jgi:hypothetical protein